MKDTYYTIQTSAEGYYSEKSSKFLAFAYEVESDEDIKNYLQELRKKYFDARHHCFAYILGADGTIFRANDDGEPAHSAGTPILNQIRSKNLTNVLVVVIRYFGGTKLGVSGLIHAYKTATWEALENAGIQEKIIEKIISIEFDYIQMNDVMKIIKQFDLKIKNQIFDNQCIIHLSVRLNLEQEVIEKFLKISGLQIN